MTGDAIVWPGTARKRATSFLASVQKPIQLIAIGASVGSPATGHASGLEGHGPCSLGAPDHLQEHVLEAHRVARHVLDAKPGAHHRLDHVGDVLGAAQLDHLAVERRAQRLGEARDVARDADRDAFAAVDSMSRDLSSTSRSCRDR
ncbi:MAG: hypothetical protein IPK07_16745 [Deltaproteobacteria bacterium]|nr:hypothetical protein [Deltaproteobacteria bacterium]